jgi:hypothetical protein
MGRRVTEDDALERAEDADPTQVEIEYTDWRPDGLAFLHGARGAWATDPYIIARAVELLRAQNEKEGNA